MFDNIFPLQMFLISDPDGWANCNVALKTGFLSVPQAFSDYGL